MPGPVIPKPVLIVQQQVKTSQGGFSNICYYEPPTGISTITQIIAVANGCQATFKPLYQSILNVNNQYVGCTVTYNDGSLFLEASSTGAAGSGTLVGAALPDQNAVVLRKITNKPGRQNRGRWYIGGMDISAASTTNPDNVDPGIYGVYEALVAALVADQTWDGLLFHARLWDRKDNQLVPIAAGALSTRIATQRARRKRSPDNEV